MKNLYQFIIIESIIIVIFAVDVYYFFHSDSPTYTWLFLLGMVVCYSVATGVLAYYNGKRKQTKLNQLETK